MTRDFVFERQLETDVEDQVCSWATNNGWMERKVRYEGRVGCRDRDFYGYGAIVLMEFKKRKGGRLSEAQKLERDRLEQQGITVHVVNSVRQGIAILLSHMPDNAEVRR